MYNKGEITIYRNNDVLIHRTIEDNEFEMCSYAMSFLNCYPVDDYYEIYGRNHDEVPKEIQRILRLCEDTVLEFLKTNGVKIWLRH